MSGLKPQRQHHPEWGHLPKVFIAYAHNPLPYVQIVPPDSDKVIQSNPEMSTEMVHERWEEEVARHMRGEEKAIEDNKLLVYHLATFLQNSSIAVAYDQLLTDVGTSNLMKWSQEQIEDSDFIILIITPSFCNFLSNEVPPEKEYLFAGHYLYNLIHNPPLNKPLLPVFLNQVKDIQLLPKALEASICYEIWEPFDVQHVPRNDDLESFYALLTRQNRYEQPKPPPGGPVKIPSSGRKRIGAGVRDHSKMRPAHHHMLSDLSQRQFPLSRKSIRVLSQNETFSAHWKHLAGQLGLTEAEVEQCEEKGSGDKEEACFQMLTTWKNSQGLQATVARMTEAVVQIQDVSLIELMNVACT